MIFAGTRSVVFLSIDDGGSWKPINFGLINTEILSLEARNDYIYAGSYLGLFRAKLSDILPNIIDDQNNKKTVIYPNPTNNYIILEYYDDVKNES